MDQQQGQLWYERALFYGHRGEEAKAKKAYAIARHFDTNLPPLPPFRNHHLLRRLERACLVTVLLILGWLVYQVFVHSGSSVRTDFPWWFRRMQGNVTTVAAPGQISAAISTTSNDLSSSNAPLPTENRSTDTPASPTLSGTPASDLMEMEVTDDHEREEWKPLLLLQSALYYYIHDQGRFPATLDQLIETGYLTAIPREPLSGRSRVVSEPSDQGGWLYTPPRVLHPQQWNVQIEAALTVNAPDAYPFPFAPLQLRVNRFSRRITLLSGDLPLKSWIISIGSEDTPTPTGHFRIVEKQVLSDSGTNPYGSRWMRIAETFPVNSSFRDSRLWQRGIGLHGTHQPDHLGKAISLGCIRMRNQDIEELYDWIPNGIAIAMN